MAATANNASSPPGAPGTLEQSWLRVYGAWEKAAADAAAAMVRDPQVLALGAGVLRAHLLWRRAAEACWQAMTSPFAAMSANPYGAEHAMMDAMMRSHHSTPPRTDPVAGPVPGSVPGAPADAPAARAEKA